MTNNIIIAIVFLIIGGVAGHYSAHLHEEHKAMDDMDMGGEMTDMDMGDDMAGMDMSAMNPEGLPMGVHNHPMREIDQSLPIPAVSLNHTKDKKGNYAIELVLENFTFEPTLVDQGAVPNEGHAHIYVNDEKISRLYDNWFYLDKKHLSEVVNTVEVTLNGNDQSEWAIDGSHIQSTIKITNE